MTTTSTEQLMTDQNAEHENTEDVSRDNIIGMMTSALADAETAIHSHPRKTIELYNIARTRHEQGMLDASDSDWSESRFTRDDLFLINRYFLATAFMSAWWALRDDGNRRDQTTAIATSLASALGMPHNHAISRFNQYESLHLRMLSDTRGNPVIGGIIFLSILASLCAAVWYLVS